MRKDIVALACEKDAAIMKKILFALIMMGMLSSQLRSAIAETSGNWSFFFDLTKEIRTEKSHSEVWIRFGLQRGPHAAFVGYEERENVNGSRLPVVRETAFEKSIEITQKEADAVMSAIEEAGLLELLQSRQEHSGKNDPYWSEHLTFHSGDKETDRWYEYPPEGGIRSKVHEAIFSYIDEMDLDDPDKPLRIDVFVKGEPGSMLTLVLSAPLWNPVYYHGKIIESMEVREERGARKAVIRISDDKGQVVNTWDAVVPDDDLASYEGVAAYEGKAIDSIITNTLVTITEGDFEPSREVTLQEILENPDKYHGKRICTKGFYDFQFEHMDFRDRKGNNVWIGEDSSFAKDKRARIFLPSLEGLILGRHRGNATVEGVFLKGPSGAWGFWPGEIVRITRVDVHFKLDYVFWIILLLMVSAAVFIVRRIKKGMRSATSDKTNDPGGQ